MSEPAGDEPMVTTAEPVTDTGATTTTSQVTTSPSIGHGTISGVLLDGTKYTLHYEGDISTRWEGSDGVVVIDIDGHPNAIGVHGYARSFPDEPFYEDGVFRPALGGVEITLYDRVKDYLGYDAEEILKRSIRGGIVDGLPTMELLPPFRWGNQNELPAHMSALYPQFAVVRGCSTLEALVCSWNGALQVIAATDVDSPAREWPDDAEIGFASLDGDRPAWDDNYLDPGPLAPRAFADVLWTGEEMIVWGGSQSDVSPDVADGAAYNLATDAWRELSPAPALDLNAASRAVMADDLMVVVSRDATLGYDPRDDEWRIIGEGRVPPEEPGKMVWDGTSVVLWTNGFHKLDLSSGEWSELPDPRIEIGPEPWMRSLHVLESGSVVAVGSTGPCEGRAVVVYTGSGWESLDGFDLGTESYADCSTPRQTAVIGKEAIAWNPDSGRTIAWEHDTGLEWLDLARSFLHGGEGAAGALRIGDRLLVNEYGRGHVYERSSNTWSSHLLPGHGTEWDMVWTGEEILMWGVPLCCVDSGARVDAWRWTPPTS